jgi:hypothetical protein
LRFSTSTKLPFIALTSERSLAFIAASDWIGSCGSARGVAQ